MENYHITSQSPTSTKFFHKSLIFLKRDVKNYKLQLTFSPSILQIPAKANLSNMCQVNIKLKGTEY